MNLDNSEPFLLLHRDAFENFQSRLQPIDDTTMLKYTSQNTSLIGYETIEDNLMETQEFDTSRIHNCSQQMNGSHGEQSNSHFKCNYSNQENLKVQRKIDLKNSLNISFVGRCIRTACDVLHGMNYDNDDIRSETIDSHFK
ncbi:hypothetical protein TNCV_126461 [Trichonephila clavipes]|nr:hypothetical protein TNCV_126461 [Trichonephila clavipes]